MTPQPSGRPQRRVLVLPVEIAGYASRIRQGFEDLGWQADLLDLTGDPFHFGARPPRDRPLRWLAAIHRAAAVHGPIALMAAGLLCLPLRLVATFTAVHRRDAIVYLFGRTLLFGLDVRLARRLGVRTVAVYLGSDSRPPWMNGNYLNVDGRIRWTLLRWRTWRTARRVRALERLVDVMVCHPATAQFLSRPCVNWLAIGMPVDAPPVIAQRPRSRIASSGVIRALHAPSRRRQKGTTEIEAAVRRLAARGIDVELVTLSGVANSVVRAEIAESDLVIDEIYSDTLLGGLGVEAAVAGVPALVFGYAADLLAVHIAQLDLPREQYAPPEMLETTVERAVTDGLWREEIARTTHAYVRDQCAPLGVAQRLQSVIDNEIPASWWLDPAGVDYFEGFGMPRQIALAGIAEYVRRYGVAALHLPERSATRSAILRAIARPQARAGLLP
jgi:hypothetical protein